MTTSTVTRLAPTQVALEFSITGEELAAAEDRAYRKLVKDVRLPGFRKGKVPRKIFEQTYGSDAVTSRAVEDVVPEVYAKAIAEHDLEPVERPTVEVLEETDGRPTRLKATVEVRPEVQAAFNDDVQRRMRRTVWTRGGCASWYIDAKGRNTTLWPSFTLPFRERTRRFDPSSYVLRRAPAAVGSA